jgi:hypothetical protein
MAALERECKALSGWEKISEVCYCERPYLGEDGDMDERERESI